MNDNQNIISSPRHINKTLYKRDLSDLDLSKLNDNEVVDIKKTIFNQFVGAYPYIIQWGLYLYTHHKGRFKETENDFYMTVNKTELLNGILSYPMNRYQKDNVWNEILKLNQLKYKDTELFRFFINDKNQVIRDIPLRIALNFGNVDKILNYKKRDTSSGNTVNNAIKCIETITIYFNKQFFSDNITGSFFKIPREFYATSKTIIDLLQLYNYEKNILMFDEHKINTDNITSQKICNLIYYFNDAWTGNKDNNNNIRMLTNNKREEELNRYLDIAENIFREHYRDNKVINQKALKNDIQTCIEIYKKCISISIPETIDFDDEIIKLPVDMIPNKLYDNIINMCEPKIACIDIIENISFFNILLYNYFIQKNICDISLLPNDYEIIEYSKKLLKYIDKLLKSYTKKQLTNLANELVSATNTFRKETSIQNKKQEANLKAQNITLKILRMY